MTGEGMERRGHLERVTQHVKEALHNPHDHNTTTVYRSVPRFVTPPTALAEGGAYTWGYEKR